MAPMSYVPGQISEEVTRPLEELVSMVGFVNQNQSQELKDHFLKTPCENKLQYRDYVETRDAGTLMRLKSSSLMSLLLVSMYGCTPAQIYAARMRILCSYGSKPRVRDVTEVLVSVSETAELHHSFLQQYEAPSRGGSWHLKYSLEHMSEIGLDGDIENVCFELKDRQRNAPGSPVNIQECANRLKDEMKKWDDRRKDLDSIMMETPLNELRQVLEEFSKINDRKPIEDILGERFEDDVHKLNVYKQLANLAIDRFMYTATEIESKLFEKVEDSLTIPFTIVLLGTMSQEDLLKIDAEYQKKFRTGIFSDLENNLPKMGLEDFVQQTMKLYLNELRGKC